MFGGRYQPKKKPFQPNKTVLSITAIAVGLMVLLPLLPFILEIGFLLLLLWLGIKMTIWFWK